MALQLQYPQAGGKATVDKLHDIRIIAPCIRSCIFYASTDQDSVWDMKLAEGSESGKVETHRSREPISYRPVSTLIEGPSKLSRPAWGWGRIGWQRREDRPTLGLSAPLVVSMAKGSS